MKKTHSFLLLLLFLAATKTFSQGFYNASQVNLIEITFEQSNWDQILDNLVAAGNEERLMGMVTINGQIFDSVGVRYKGNSSYSANRVKNPLNIKLDYLIDDQTIEGYGTIKLANVFKDPSFVREVMSYEIAREYFPAPQANYANVYINGTYLGLYTNDQDVDSYFARSNFSTSGRVRVKGEIGEGLPPGGMGGVWQYSGTDSSAYENKYVIESNLGWQKLIGFLDTLNNNNAMVDQVLNVDRHLWFLAFSNLFVNLDGPINNPQNYYLFEDLSGRFNPIPWDLNECFGVFTNHQTLGNLGITQMQQFSPFANSTAANFPVVSKILNNTLLKKMYVAHMKTILNEQITNGAYLSRALELQAIIDAYVLADPNKFYTYANFIANINTAVGGSGPPPNQQIVGITQLMEARKTYLFGLAEFTAAQPTLNSPQILPQIIHIGDLAQVNINASDATEVWFAYRSNELPAFQTLRLYDDGLHNDGQANDGVFGNDVLIESSLFEYYFFAVNSQAAAFLPERAANTFYAHQITGGLVINEFMADNNSIIADQDGDYDDWIELYNNSGQDIQLGGYFLSDNLNNPQKWIFPDTLLPDGAYLIVWADEDEDQQGLHASFKLSKAGENIVLTDNSLNTIDMVSFGAQQTDLSTGRYPNATGPFIMMTPSPESLNLNGFVGQPEIVNVETRLFPNPFDETFVLEVYLEGEADIQVELIGASGISQIIMLNSHLGAGTHQLQLNALNVPSGLYLCRVTAGGKNVGNYKVLKMKS